MKLSCNVVQDLLPLYHDGICSGESRELVDAHLHECAACKDVLHNLKEEVVLGDKVDAAQPLLSVKMTWNQEKRKVFLRALSIALVVCVLMASAWSGLTTWDCVPLTADEFVVLRLAELKDGHIQVRTTTAYRGVQCDIHYNPEDNAIYEVMKRPVIAERKSLPSESPLYAGMLSNYQGGWGQIVFDPDGEQVWSNVNGELLPIKAYYIGEPGSDDAVLIWEEGMELPPADEETEEYWAKFIESEKIDRKTAHPSGCAVCLEGQIVALRSVVHRTLIPSPGGKVAERSEVGRGTAIS